MHRLARSLSIPSVAAHALPVVVLLALTACGGPQQSVSQPAQQTQSLLKPVASLHDLMVAEVDTSADVVWDAVETDISAAGTEDKQPRTPEEWDAVRQGAVRLVEAANLLLIDGRHVASTPFGPEAQGALGSDEIERRLTANRARFDQFAVALRDTAGQALAAIDAHDARTLLQVGGALDAVCESCHLAFWYPDQVIPPFPQQGVPRLGVVARAGN